MLSPRRSVHGAVGWLQAEPGHGTPPGIHWDGAVLVAGGHLSPISSQEPGTASSKHLPAHEHPPMAPRAGGRQQSQPLCSLITPTTPNLPLISTSTALCPPPEQLASTPPPSLLCTHFLGRGFQALIPHSPVPSAHWGHGNDARSRTTHVQDAHRRHSTSAASLHPHSTKTHPPRESPEPRLAVRELDKLQQLREERGTLTPVPQTSGCI